MQSLVIRSLSDVTFGRRDGKLTRPIEGVNGAAWVICKTATADGLTTSPCNKLFTWNRQCCCVALQRVLIREYDRSTVTSPLDARDTRRVRFVGSKESHHAEEFRVSPSGVLPHASSGALWLAGREALLFPELASRNSVAHSRGDSAGHQSVASGRSHFSRRQDGAADGIQEYFLGLDARLATERYRSHRCLDCARHAGAQAQQCDGAVFPRQLALLRSIAPHDFGRRE